MTRCSREEDSWKVGLRCATSEFGEESVDDEDVESSSDRGVVFARMMM